MNRNTAPAPRKKSGDAVWDYREIYHLLREKAWLIALCTLSFILLAGVYVMRAPKIYAAHSVILVEQQERKVVNIQDVNQDDLKALEVMKTVEQSFTTDELMLRVAKACNLANDPQFLPKYAMPYSDDELVLALLKRFSVKLRRGTRLIDVTAKSENPLRAKQLAQSLVEEYVRQSFDQRVGVSNVANGFLLQEADRLKAKLEKSERDLQNYREENNAVSLEDKQNIIVETLKDLNLKLNAARAERMRLEYDFAKYKASVTGDPKQLLAISIIAESPSVLDAKKRVADQETEIAMLTRRYRAEHPKFIQAQSQLTQIDGELGRTILKAGEAIGTAYESALANEHQLVDALRDQEKLSFELNKIAIPYNVLVRDVDADRSLYQSILTRLKETDVTKALEVNPIRLIEPARAPAEPVSPKKVPILLLSLFAGLGFGTGFCLLLNGMDTSVKTVDEAQRLFNLPVISAVPRLREREAAGELKGVPMLTAPHSPVAESFRTLRTVFELKDITDRQVLLFTSAMPDEGKTFCSINCAVALAQQGYRTLLVDTDLRRPSIAKSLRFSPDKRGLTDCLSGAATVADAIQDSGTENLKVLTAGALARKPAELLSGENLAKFFKDPAFVGFERVVFDTAPVNAVSDALHLVKHATSVCLVVRAGKTPAKSSQRAQAALADANAQDMGIILNQLPAHGGAGYYYYSAEYGSSGVYGAKEFANA